MSLIETRVRAIQQRLALNAFFEQLALTAIAFGGAAIVVLLLQRLLAWREALWAAILLVPVALWFERWRRGRQSRLTRNSLLGVAFVGLGALGVAAGAAVLMERVLQPFAAEWHIWAGVTLTSLLACLALTHLARRSRDSAAVELDGAASLRERVSSALALRGSSDPFAQAVVRDAEQRVAAVRPASAAPLRLPPRWPWGAGMLSAALLVGYLTPQMDLLGRYAPAEETKQQAAERVEQQTIQEEVNRTLDEVATLLDENPALDEAADAIEPLKLPEDQTLETEQVRRDAMKRLESMEQRLEAMQEQMQRNPVEALARELAKMEPLEGDNPAAKLSQALSKGDFSAAKQALEELQQQLNEAEQSGDPEKQAAAQQMQQQLDQLAEQLKQADASESVQKELKHEAGLSDEQAQQVMQQAQQQAGGSDPQALQAALQQALAQQGKQLSQQQLEQLAQQMSQCQQANGACQNLAQSLAQAAQSANMSGGDAAASQALQGAMSQLSNMEMAQQLSNELAAQMSAVQNAKQNVGMCNSGSGQTPGANGLMAGVGHRDNQAFNFGQTLQNLTPTKIEGQIQQGPIIGQMLMDASNQTRGEASATATAAVQSAVRDAQDAVEREDIPRQYHNAVREYFDRLAGLNAESRE